MTTYEHPEWSPKEPDTLKDHVDAVLEEQPQGDWHQAARYRLQRTLESHEKESKLMNRIRTYRRSKLGWAMATTLVIIICAIIGVFPTSGGNLAFADVMERIRAARTMVCNQITHVEGLPDLHWKILFREPGAVRREMDDGAVSISDTVQKRRLHLIPVQRLCILTETSPDQKDQEKANLIQRLRTLPDRATETLPRQEMDGHTVQGFRLLEEGQQITLWADVNTKDPVQVRFESPNAPGTNKIMKDFQLDVSLEDALFSTIPPSGYRVEARKEDSSPSTEQDLVNFLRVWVTHPTNPNGLFPSSLNPGELAKPSKAMEAPPGQGSTTEQIQKNAPLYHWFGFVLKMKPENGWHYAGAGIKFGNPAQPIFWWKPDGSIAYRVIMGDLSITESQAPPGPASEGFHSPSRR